MTILDCVQIDIPHPVFLWTSFITLPLVQSQTSHPVPFCFGHSPLQPFLCWFLLGIHPEVVLNSFHTSGLVLSSLPISRCTSGFSSHASDMVLDEFLQFQISRLDFPTLFRKSSGLFHQSYLTFGVQLNFIGCPLDFIPKCGAHTWVWGTAYELRPSPSFLIRPSSMVLNTTWHHLLRLTTLLNIGLISKTPVALLPPTQEVLNLISTSSRTSRSSLSSAPAPYDELSLKQLTDVNTFHGHQEPPLDARINSLTSSPFTNFAQEFKRKHKKVLSFVYGLLASMPSVPFRQQPRLPSRLTPHPSKKAQTTIPTALAVLSA
ncbi:hypothetical protein EDD22DRAFT_998333 [Suillus occidentalis]|nr:hypothetical protein EDD22DRAFT_998333 [Suillus occidentalis]